MTSPRLSDRYCEIQSRKVIANLIYERAIRDMARSIEAEIEAEIETLRHSGPMGRDLAEALDLERGGAV